MSKILRNTSYLLIAQIITKAISFFYVLYLARELGVNNFGIFSLALSYFSLMTTLTDLGFSRYLTREISKNKDDSLKIFPTVLFFRFLVSAIVFLGFSLFIFLFDADKSRSTFTTIIALALFPQSVALTIDSLFIGLHKIKYTALGILALNITTVLFGTLFIRNNYGILGPILAFIFGQFIYACLFIILLKKEKLEIFNNVSFKLFKSIINGSLVYGFLGIMGLIYFRVDTVLLSYLKGSYDTGLYSAAFKFLDALAFIPIALALVVFPIFSRLNESKPEDIKPMIRKIFIYMGVLGGGVTLGFLIVLPPFIRMFLPDYIPSIEAVKILAFAAPFMFIHVPLAQVLLSTEKYVKSIFIISVATMSFNIILNLIFIPQYGFIAASYVTVLSDVFSLLVLSATIKKFLYR